MMSYASLGNMEGCLGTFSKFKEHAFYANTTTINIMLAAILYSSNPIFNRRMFFQLLESHFGTGDLVEDRCTYAHVLLGCQKAGDKIFAMKTFDQFLLTKLRITLKMRNTLRTLLGEGEFNAYISNLDNGDRKRLRNVDEDEATFREKNTFVPGNVDAVVTLPAVLGGKRVYNYIAKTEPYKTPGKTNPSGVRDYNPPQQDWTPFSARADPNRKQWSPSDGAKSVQKPKIKWGPSSKVN